MTSEALPPTHTPNPRDSRAASKAGGLVSNLAGDPEMAELIRSFVEEIPERVRLVEEYWARHEFGELRRIAHQLKGACGGYGFPQVGQAAANLENGLAGRGKDELESVAERVRELVEICRRVRAS
jgi:HPt (histidine-containing phosphotransfer) domain-containing protein